MHALDGGAAGTGHHVLERAGMLAGFQRHFRAPQHRLRREFRRHVPRQTGSHAAVAQRFDDEVHVSRPAAAQSGHRIEQRFLELKGHADGGKHFLRKQSIFHRRIFAECIGCRRSADQRRRIRHDTNDASALVQAVFQSGQRHPRCDGTDQMFLGDQAANFLEHAGDLVGFDSEHEHLGGLGRLEVRSGGFNAHLLRECGTRGVDGITGDDLIGVDNFCLNKSFGQRGSHFASAEKTNAELCGHARIVEGQAK